MAAVRVQVSRAQGSHLPGVGPQVRALGEWLQGGVPEGPMVLVLSFQGSSSPWRCALKSGVLALGAPAQGRAGVGGGELPHCLCPGAGAPHRPCRGWDPLVLRDPVCTDSPLTVAGACGGSCPGQHP